MLIATHFRRPTAPVDLGGKVYYFTPRTAGDANSEHVAVVDDPSHIQALLAITEGYYIPTDQELTAVVARPQATVATLSVTDTATAAATATSSDTTTDAPANDVIVDPDVLESARNLIALSWQALKGQLDKGGIPTTVLQTALELEQAKPADEQHQTKLKMLSQALGSDAAQA